MHFRRRLAALALAVCTAAATLMTSVPARAADTSVTVDFATAGGAPSYHASGTLYGMTPAGSAPPSSFYTGIKWRFERAGGAQLNSGGYATSLADYQTRWNSTLAQYKRTVSLGGTFILLPHDLWGADGTTSQAFPGDNGDWTQFDDFVAQLVGDVRANGMTVEWDLWNEPDLGIFWNRPQSQYLDMWSRFYSQVRAAFPGQLIVGPSMSGKPGSGNGWWTTYLSYVKAHNAAPDIWSWHDEPGDPAAEVGPADSTLSAAGLTRTRPYQINEYATPDMQTPGGGAWFISRLERAGADGLRGNWGSGLGLHDNEAGLLTDLGSGQYQALGEWYLYQFYGSQSGNIVNFIPGGGFDGLATKDNTAGNAKILLGSNGDTGNLTVNLTGLNTTSVVRNGQVRAVVQRVPYNNGSSVSGPQTISDTTLSVQNNAASVSVPYSDARDGYTVTLLPPSTTGGTSGELHAVGAAKCLDVPNSSTTGGTQLQIWSCTGAANQVWTRSSAGQLTVYSGSSQMCLDADNQGTTPGTKVIIWPCNGQTNQQWTVNANGTITGGQSGLCLDVTGARTANGTLVELWTCNGGSNQQWTLG